MSPFDKFESWYEEALKKELEANAMTISTVDQSKRPSSRVVLLKSFDVSGFVFYTNIESQKGRQIRNNPAVSLCFHWKSIKSRSEFKEQPKWWMTRLPMDTLQLGTAPRRLGLGLPLSQAF